VSFDFCLFLILNLTPSFMNQRCFAAAAYVFFALFSTACQQVRHQPPVIDSFTAKVDMIDPVNDEFPGGRGADQLLIYTPAYGASTGTNIYGIEAVVTDGVISSVGGNDQQIPPNGFVISGHGKASRWISEHLSPGISVRIIDSLLLASVTVESRLREAANLIGRSKHWLDTLDRASAHLSQEMLDRYHKRTVDHTIAARKAYESGDSALSIALADSVIVHAKSFFYHSFPARDQEIRAVWMAMQETTSAELRATVQAVAAAGFNTICPQVIFGGYAIYPDAHPDLKQHPQFAGRDPMAELVVLCEEYQLQLIPWVWVYFVGMKDSPLVASKQEWLGKSHKGSYASEMELGYYFFCQSRPEVRTFWLEVYARMLKKYAFDGLQLDYIRYAVSEPYESGFCYCDHCRTDFKAAYGRDPLDLNPLIDSLAWSQWNEWRVANVSNFVAQVHDLLARVAPGVRLSADIFPDVEVTLRTKMQDWGDWLRKGDMDDIYTMTYTADLAEVKKTSQYLQERISGDQRGIVGLAPYMGLTPDLLLEEILLAQQSGADGLCFFHFGSFSSESLRALKAGPFRIKAHIPQ
jgi:uncharacterized lipoprotein YddW (UPF0748 family)